MPQRAPVYDKAAIYADAMLACIERELPDATSFTRDDIMYLSVFAHVATITRYHYVGIAVRHAVAAKKLVKVGHIDYVLAGKQKGYKGTPQEEYADTILSLIKSLPKGVWVNVPNILNAWTSDHHLTTSTKRTIVREELRWLSKEGVLEETGLAQYALVKE